MIRDQLFEARETKHLTLRIMRFYQAIAVEQDAFIIPIQHNFLLIIACTWHQPQRHASRIQFTYLAAMPSIR